MIETRLNVVLIGLIALVLLARPVAAFGAGNIASVSKVEGQNWRHGDIEDALLSLVMARALNGKKFNKINVSRVYFGNWLRDYSQAIDVGTVKAVSAEAIRLLLCVLGFLTFGYGSGEFEVTAERLGCYRPEDHIDNPKDYADNKDARDYDPRLRGPIDEGVELAIDERTGMKNYIANENANIMTSAQHVRNLFNRCIDLGRRYKNSGNKAEKYEALRLMGTGLHCLEDFFAHSNYCELALIEMGERDVFPHVGSDTRIRLEGANDDVYPVVTGTFGGVDFLHSVTGEVSDKLTQNEIDELEGTLKQSKASDTSFLRELLDKIPSSLLGRNHAEEIDQIQSNAQAAQLENVAVSPRNEEEFTLYIKNIYAQIMPVIRFHDDIMKTVGGAIDHIPVLPKIVDQLEEQLSIFVFSIMAPFIVPLIRQIRNELRTGSEEIIQSSDDQQHIVFNDSRSSDPTHSMLSKDHFSNILNEVAGRTAAKTLHWVVPQLMEAMDDDNVDVNRLCDRIITGVMHHPAQRNMGEDGAREARGQIFESVVDWWRQMDNGQREDYKRKLSRDGVFRGENHKEGVHDTGHGHGCSGKLEMRRLYGEPETVETKIAGAAAQAIFQGASNALGNVVEQQTGYRIPNTQNNTNSEEGGFSGFLHSAGQIIKDALGKEQRDNRHNEDNDSRRNEYNDNRRNEDNDSRRNEDNNNRRNEYNENQRNEYDDNRRNEYNDNRRNEHNNNLRNEYDDNRHNDYNDNRRNEHNNNRRNEYDDSRRNEYDDNRRNEYDDNRRNEYGGNRRNEYDDSRRNEYDGNRRNEYDDNRRNEYDDNRRNEYR
ncbi:Putative Heterokaryon incompatibility protein Het-C [[Torrubiella] hemipterigena]|uniref:Putative Heterokaryon incompatibility protein Het-C n=1 Tax=[Torrubiella] hemipterigena TaxID=1531966 RepID=A0A0A1TG40_9HYPO|nr:Putative Heterokaryon incompatibility protein Het-C [[Torrubiella] hemipterigena]